MKNYDKIIGVRFPLSIIKIIKVQAKKNNVSISDYLRNILINSLHKKKYLDINDLILENKEKSRNKLIKIIKGIEL